MMPLCLQALTVLLFIIAHDAMLILAGFALASKYFGLTMHGTHTAVNQALQVYANPTRSNPFSR